jgi:hypothetical protein
LLRSTLNSSKLRRQKLSSPTRRFRPRVKRRYLLRRFWISARGFWGKNGNRLSWIFCAGLLILIVVNLAVQYGINVWNRLIFDARSQFAPKRTSVGCQVLTDRLTSPLALEYPEGASYPRRCAIVWLPFGSKAERDPAASPPPQSRIVLHDLRVRRACDKLPSTTAVGTALLRNRHKHRWRETPS